MEAKIKNILREQPQTIDRDNVTQDLLLIIILTSSDFNKETIVEIEDIGKEVSKQIRNLWIE